MSTGDRPVEGTTLLRRGERALRGREPARARVHFEQAVSVFRWLDMHLGLAQAHRGVANAEMAQRDLGAAEGSLERVIDSFAHVHTWVSDLAPESREVYSRLANEGQGLCGVAGAKLTLRQGSDDRAHTHINRAYPLFRTLGDSAAVAICGTAPLDSLRGRVASMRSQAHEPRR